MSPSPERQQQPQPRVQVYFCRHAESRHNANFDRTTDVDLSELGEAQAKALTGEFDLVLCSPMRRARRTLELSSIRYDRLEEMHELREWIYDNSDRLPTDARGLRESQRDVARRCEAVRHRLRTEVAAATGPVRILLVSHSVFGGSLFDLCGGSHPDCIDNAVIYPFNFKG